MSTLLATGDLLSGQLARLARLTPEARRAWLLSLPTEVRVRRLPFLWEFWARPNQLWRPGEEFITLYQAGRGFGKALAEDTPLPTPTGWTTVGAVRVGDLLLDEHGRPCRVTATFEVDAVEAWRLAFSDGTTIDACADHLWVTLTAQQRKQMNRRGESIPDNWAAANPITTRELVRTLTVGKRSDRNHCIPVASLTLPPAALLVDPYVLGAWLGDGDSRDAVMTCHADDAAHMQHKFEAGGVTWGPARPDKRRPQVLRVAVGKTRSSASLRTALRHLGVLRNKHIPTAYLRAGHDQRLALLQGLVDTDGHVNQSTGGVEITSTREALALGIAELARTLGQKPSIYVGRSTIGGVDKGQKWRICWRPTVAVASLPRKAAQVRPVGAQGNRNQHRMVVGATPLPSQHMRCLTVDSPHSMFLAGEGMIPTHNTRVGAEAVRWVAENPERCGFGRPPLAANAPVIALVGRTTHDAISTMIWGSSGIMAISPPWFMPRFSMTHQRLEWPNGMRAHYFTAEKPETLRGPNIGFVWADEVAFFKQPRGERVGALENIEQALRKSHGRAVYTTTPLPTADMFGLHERQMPAKGRAQVQVPAGPDEAPAPTETAEVKSTGEKHARPAKRKKLDVRIVRGSSLENAANVNAEWIERQKAKLGTRIGRQEVGGELLVGNPRTLFPFELLNSHRISLGELARAGDIRPIMQDESYPDYCRSVLDLTRICIACDPAGSEDPEAAEFGIVVAGLSAAGTEYSLADLSGHHGPTVWPSVVYDASIMWSADAIVGEVNYGGDMIGGALETHTRLLRAQRIAVRPVQFVALRTGKSGKGGRLKIFAQAMEAGLVKSVIPALNDRGDAGDPSMWAPMEAQLHAFNPAEDSDHQVARVEIRQRDGSLKMETLLLDRMDARVWAHLWLSGHEIAKNQSALWLGANEGARAVRMLESLRG